MINLGNASPQFVAFGLAAALLINLRHSPAWRFNVLLSVSVLFVALLGRDLKSFLPLAGFLALGYGGLWLIRRKLHRALLASVVVVIVAYAWLKKYTVLPEASFLPFAYLTVGLSYIFFRVLHLLIEAGQDEEQPPIGAGAYLLYALNFTTFVSGPIQRFDEFARETLALDARIVAAQLERIVIGFFKVNILGMLLHAVQLDALQILAHPAPEPLKMFAAFRLSVVYPFFLYANFSGYIDIVIALARLMRLKLPENFDRPFSASSFLDFWNRWHITLSLWLKTYVYNSLLTVLMRRVSNPRLHPYLGVLCFFVTFFLVGIWHGRTSEFIVFGVLQGGGVAIDKLWQVQLAQRLGNKRYRALAKEPLYIAFGRGLTFSWFAFTLFWFWASWREIGAAFGGLSPAAWLEVWLCTWLIATAVLAAWEWGRGKLLAVTLSGGPLVTHRYLRTMYASALLLVCFVITVLLNQAAPDIVYKAF
jgi:D-alanyl-lipoteichoic acid acyltransferase DltB (MBOAT superfamily)